MRTPSPVLPDGRTLFDLDGISALALNANAMQGARGNQYKAPLRSELRVEDKSFPLAPRTPHALSFSPHRPGVKTEKGPLWRILTSTVRRDGGGLRRPVQIPRALRGNSHTHWDSVNHNGVAIQTVERSGSSEGRAVEAGLFSPMTRNPRLSDRRHHPHRNPSALRSVPPPRETPSPNP